MRKHFQRKFKTWTIFFNRRWNFIILLILDDEYKEFLLSTLEEVKSRKAYTIVISNFNIENKLDDLIIVPKLNVLSSTYH